MMLKFKFSEKFRNFKFEFSFCDYYFQDLEIVTLVMLSLRKKYFASRKLHRMLVFMMIYFEKLKIGTLVMFSCSKEIFYVLSRYMRQNSKDVSSADQAIVTVEKASRKVVFTTGSPSQVTMSLVTSSPLMKSAVQVHNLSTQSSPSTHLSLVPPSATVNSVTTPIVSAPLSIQLARPVSQVGPNGPHQTLTVVPSGLRIEQQPSLVVVRQSELQKQQQL